MNGSAKWLKRNLGDFSIFASLEDLQKINYDFSAVSNTLIYEFTISIYIYVIPDIDVCISFSENNDV